jgi:hypothetical protein
VPQSAHRAGSRILFSCSWRRARASDCQAGIGLACRCS